MKNVMLTIVAALLMAACATLTPEEKAARVQHVVDAVGSKNYRININTMRPMRGGDRSVFNHWIKVQDNTVDCDLPYAGRDDIPTPKSPLESRLDHHIVFKTTADNYLLAVNPKDREGTVTFDVQDGVRKYKFSIRIISIDNVQVRLTPDDRDFIDYEGTISPL